MSNPKPTAAAAPSACPTQPVLTTAPADLGLAALRHASQLARTSALMTAERQRIIIDREETYLRHLQRSRFDGPLNLDDLLDTDTVVIGPVQSILLDPTLATLTGIQDDARIERVKQIISATTSKPIGAHAALLLLYIIGIIGCIHLRTDLHIPLVLALLGALPCAFGAGRTASALHRSGIRIKGPGDIRIPPRYPAITLDEGLQLATITPQLWHNPDPGSPPAGPTNHATPTSQGPAAETAEHDDRHRRIADIHAAINELDAEWLDYQLDLEAWFLTKPQLRNLNDPVIKAYRDADAALRDHADNLTDHCTDTQITAAEDAARTALKAWGTANRHALSIGVSALTPSEEAALHTLHGLVAQLNDRATPKAMWPKLIKAITRTMDKLTTVPFTLRDIAKLPVIEAESRLRELAP